MTVLSVLRCGGAVGIPSIKFLWFGNTARLNQLVGQNNGLIIFRQFGKSSGKGQTDAKSSELTGIRVAEFTKHPNFRQFKVTPTRYSWHKYKDMFHFYFFLGFIPCMTVVILVNIFIGPPKLAIPEPGYIPKSWEYQRHPITQFMCKHIFPSYQQVYERNLFYVHEEFEKKRMRALAKKAEALMAERGDFYNYWGAKTNRVKYGRQAYEEQHRLFHGMGHPIDDDSALGQPLDR